MIQCFSCGVWTKPAPIRDRLRQDRDRGCFCDGVAEGLKQRDKNPEKALNGCLGFEVFRKRILLIMTNFREGKKP